MTDWSMTLPRNLWDLKILSHGPEDNAWDHIIERRTHERLGQHPRIVTLISLDQRGIGLERIKYPIWKLLIDLRPKHQGDIGIHNLLLEDDDNIKFCDFAGSSIDGENSWVCLSIHAMYAFVMNPATAMPTVQSELFALGSVLSEISTAFRSHDGKEFHEFEALYAASEFPAETRSLLLGDVIWKCWTSQYMDSGEVVAEIKMVEARISAELSQTGAITTLQ